MAQDQTTAPELHDAAPRRAAPERRSRSVGRHKLDDVLLRAARRPWSIVGAIIWAALLTLAATVPRLLLAGALGQHSPFTFYFFSIFLATAFAGGRAGVATLVFSGVIGLTWFVEPFGRLSEATGAYLRLALFASTAGLIIFSVVAMRRALRAVGDARDRDLTVAREMGHRIKNVFAVVQGIIAQTGRSTTNVEEFKIALERRLEALALAQNVEHGPGDLRVCEVVRHAVSPFADHRILITAQDDRPLSPNLAKALILALHELATNATKYGALLTPQGRVGLQISETSDAMTTVLWAETGGPPVAPPSRCGFGTRLIYSAIEAERGQVALGYDRDGVNCVFSLPVLSRPGFETR